MEVRRRGLQLRWVLGGALVMLASAAVVGGVILVFAIPDVLARGTVEQEDPDAVTVLLVGLGAGLLASFFLGGVAIGRLSKGRTILEPGLAACIAAGVLLLLTGALDRGLAAMLCAAPVLALLAMFGGWLGERWQGSGPA